MSHRRMISIVVPCYNEEQTIPLLRNAVGPVVSAFSRSYDVETLLVDDGSTDNTLAALQELAPGLNGHVLKHATNRGISAAFRTGFQAAKGDIVCTIDADCTFDPLELVPMVAELESSGADVVVASPYHPQGGVEGVPAWRLLFSRGASRLYRHLLPVKLYSYTACFRAFKREVVGRLQFEDAGFLGVTEMLASAILQGFSVVERPMILRRRVTGASKMRTLRVIGDHVRFMIRLWTGKLKPSPAHS